MNPIENKADVGIIVGRFQVHRLHAAHRDLIRSVIKRHQKVIVFLGSKPGVLVTRKNPLDFQSRKAMIQDEYPAVTVLPITDQPTNEGWSKTLDERIQEITESASCILYGSRDGFVPFYSGRNQVVQLEATVNVSGNEVRNSVGHEVRVEPAFRRGVIYAAYNQHPTSYQTVDCAVINHDTDRVLLGRKRNDPLGQWRFLGGFVSPEDSSLEAAASRELSEETGGMLSVHANPTYLGSQRIDDWRYRGEGSKIMTALFAFQYFAGGLRPSDDIDDLCWFDSAQVTTDKLVAAHHCLLPLLTAHLQRSNKNAEPNLTDR